MPAQPQNVPTITKPTPIVLDELLIETTDSNKALYDRFLEVGHFHPNQIQYPSYRLLKIQPTQYGQIQYVWGNEFTAQDSYNVVKDYSADATGFPTFMRSYRVLRSEYLVNGPATTGSAFTGIVAVAVTAGGTGYTKDFPVTFSGGSGSGGTGWAIVNTSNGSVIRVELNAVGTGYTAAPTVVLSAGDGASATATAVIQSAAAVLISEKHSKLDDADPYSSLYDRVVRAYETLPGPYIPFTRYDPLLGPIQGQRRAVRNTGQSASLTATVKTTYEGREGSSIVSWEITETNSDGTGGSGNPAYPIVPSEDIEEENRFKVSQTTQLTTDTTTKASLVISGGGTVATYTHFEAYNQFQRKKVIDVWAMPGPVIRLPDELYDKQLGYITGTKQLVVEAGQVQVESNSGRTRYESSEYGKEVLWEFKEAWSTGAFPALEADDIDEPRGPFKTIPQIVTDITTAGSLVVTGNNLATLIKFVPYNAFLRTKVTETWAVPGKLLRLPSETYDKELGFITGTKQLVENASQPQLASASGRTRYESSEYGEALLWEFIESWDTGAFPVVPASQFDGGERGAVALSTQLTTDLATAGSTVVVSTTATTTNYEFYDEFLRRKRLEVWTVPALLLVNDKHFDKDLGDVYGTRQLVVSSSQAPTANAASRKRYEKSSYGDAIVFEFHEYWDVAQFPTTNREPYYDPSYGAGVRTTKIVVATGSEVGSWTTGDGFTTHIDYKVRDPYLLYRITDVWAVPGYVRKGQSFKRSLGIVVPFTEQLCDRATAEAKIGDANTDIIPQNEQQSLARITLSAALATAYENVMIVTADYTNITFPAVLRSLEMVYNINAGQGSSNQIGQGFSSGTSSSLSMSLPASANSSMAVTADLREDIRTIRGQNLPVKVLRFFLAAPFTEADLLAKLSAGLSTTVNAWPQFNDVPLTFSLYSQQASIRVGAAVQQSNSQSPGQNGQTNQTFVRSYGTSQDVEVGVAVKTVRYPPTIHGPITITNASYATYITASCAAGWGQGVNWPALYEPMSGNAGVGAGCAPSGIPATSPISAIPTNGLYLWHTDQSDSDDFPYVFLRCEVFDFSRIPS